MTIDETAGQIVDIAWAEFTDRVGPSAMPLHPEMRALMMALVTSGMKVEREACAKIVQKKAEECKSGPMQAAHYFEQAVKLIRARGESAVTPPPPQTT